MTDKESSGGIGFLGMLTILFIGLKLTNQITWSWWWVLSPLWLFAVVILALIILMIIGNEIWEKMQW